MIVALCIAIGILAVVGSIVVIVFAIGPWLQRQAAWRAHRRNRRDLRLSLKRRP